MFEQAPAGAGPASLENANYHNTFSLSSEESEASSSSTPSPRDAEDTEVAPTNAFSVKNLLRHYAKQAEAGAGRLAGVVDRLRSGVAATRGFERF